MKSPHKGLLFCFLKLTKAIFARVSQ